MNDLQSPFVCYGGETLCVQQTRDLFVIVFFLFHLIAQRIE